MLNSLREGSTSGLLTFIINVLILVGADSLERILLKTIQKFIDPSAEIKSIESKPIHIGLQAVSLHRHTIQLKKLENIQLSLITKYASKIERKVLNRLHSQGANVPFFLTDGSADEESTYTLIHNDLNPGNVLVHNNSDVFFIDWEDARYGSLFLDFPLRCTNPEQEEKYRQFLEDQGVVYSDQHFRHLFTIASRYLGLRYMSWNLGAWSTNRQAKEDLKKYLDMVVGNINSI